MGDAAKHPKRKHRVLLNTSSYCCEVGRGCHAVPADGLRDRNDSRDLARCYACGGEVCRADACSSTMLWGTPKKRRRVCTSCKTERERGKR